MITIPKLLILLVIIVVVFGTKRLRNVGTDLGEAIKNFRTAIKEGESEDKSNEIEPVPPIEGQVTSKKTEPEDTHV